MPLHITPDNYILDGIHRWRFAKELGILSLPVTVFRYEHAEEESCHAIDANFDRRHINEGQKAMLKLRKQSFQEKLKQRQDEALERKRQAAIETNNKRWNNTTDDRSVPQGTKREDQGKAIAQVAKTEGVSTRTLYRAKAVAQADPERAEAVLKGEISLTKAYQEVKAEEQVQEVKKLQEAERPLTDLEIMTKLSIPVQPYDVWNFPTCDDRFGYDYPLPEAHQAREIGDGLYNSERGYLEQIDAYKQFQGKQ